jgi:hypothetical protein
MNQFRLNCVLSCAAFCLFLNLIGCAPRQAALPIAFQGENVHVLSRDEQRTLQALLASRSEEITSYRALWDVRVSAPDREEHFRVVAVWQAPHFLRLEFLPLQAAYAFALILNTDAGLTIVEPLEKRFRRSNDPARDMQRLFGMPLTASFFPLIALGRIPKALLVEPNRSYLRNEFGKTLVQATNVAIELQAHTEAVDRVGFTQEGIELTYEESTGTQAVYLPAKILLAVPRHATRVHIEVQRAEIGKDLRPELFEWVAPPSFTQEKLQTRAAPPE